MISLAELEARPTFALLGPGFSNTGGWTLLEDLAADPEGGLVFQPFEADRPLRFSGRARPIDLELSAVRTPRVTLNGEGYAAQVESIREAIARGDVYQVCLTLRARATGVSGAELLGTLCRPAVPRFAAWVRLPDGTELVSGSPELLLEREGNTVRSEPMKGTARLSEAATLEASEKDRAELAMITDLVRNDLTPVCVPRSIRVVADRRTITLPYALQTVSVIEGTLETGRSDLDALAALHPGGSVTGAPKNAALAMIRALEPTPRGAYCGALGWRDGEEARYALLIRTAERDAETWRYGVGSGVVYDSQAAAEWAELAVKLGALGGDLHRSGP